MLIILVDQKLILRSVYFVYKLLALLFILDSSISSSCFPLRYTERIIGSMLYVLQAKTAVLRRKLERFVPA
jgi:hypothetical protein